MFDENIIKFLIKRKNTYAGKGPETTPSRPNSHDKPIWSMNYAGRVLGENFKGDFLKEALLKVPFDKPFRGRIFTCAEIIHISVK